MQNGNRSLPIVLRLVAYGIPGFLSPSPYPAVLPTYLVKHPILKKR
jgi:hypothetical protein